MRRRHQKAKQAREQLERFLFDALEAEDGRESGRRLDGVFYSPERTTKATIQDKARVIDYFKEHDTSMLTTELRKGNLNQWVRERLDNGQPLPEGLGHYDDTYVSTIGLTKQQNEKEDPDAERE